MNINRSDGLTKPSLHVASRLSGSKSAETRSVLSQRRDELHRVAAMNGIAATNFVAAMLLFRSGFDRCDRNRCEYHRRYCVDDRYNSADDVIIVDASVVMRRR